MQLFYFLGFFNCASEGIICKASGPNSEFLLTDARCLPGSEGGAICMKITRNQRFILIILYGYVSYHATQTHTHTHTHTYIYIYIYRYSSRVITDNIQDTISILNYTPIHTGL